MMAGYEIDFDGELHNVICRMTPLFTDMEAQDLKRDLALCVTNARRHGAVRILWDHRAGGTLSAETAEIVRTVLVDTGKPTDRIAVLVRDSISKVRARSRKAGSSEVFASENAALTWLAVGRDVGAKA